MTVLADQRTQYEVRLKALLDALGTTSGGTGGGTINDGRLSIINYVKAKLDELVPESEGLVFSLSSAPNVSDPLNLLINAHIDEATKNVIMSAPLTSIVPTKSSETVGTPFVTGAKQGYVQLDDTFLRLAQFKMADWDRTIEKAITPSDALYKLQTNEYLRGGIVKPVLVLNWRTVSSNPKRVLEYYSIIDNHNIDKFYYLHDMVAEDFITANRKLLPSLAWMCAGIIMEILGQMDNFKMAMDQVKLSYANL